MAGTCCKYQYAVSGTYSSVIDFGELIADASTNPLLVGKDSFSLADFVSYVEGAGPNGLGATIDMDGSIYEVNKYFNV